MSKLDGSELEKVVGGSTTVSGTILNAFVNIIKFLYEAGEGVGSSIRRFSEDDLCPLE